MTVQEVHLGAGRFSVPLRPDTPRSVLDVLDARKSGFGHVVITTAQAAGKVDDSILPGARYVGVFRKQDDEFTISGAGLSVWIADEDGKGPSYTGSLFTATGAFSEWVAALTPIALTSGFTSAVPGNFTKAYGHTTLRGPLDEVCSYFGTEWRVNTDFSFDVGYPADLFHLGPSAVIVRKAGDGGRDYNVTGIVGDLRMQRDVEDLVRRVVLFSGDRDAPTITISTSGISDASYPLRDPQGNSIRIDQHEEDFSVVPGQEPGVVQGIFEGVRDPRSEISLDGTSYDIGGDVRVGDNVWVFDLLRGIYNMSNPRTYRGQTIYPDTIRCVGLTWPIRRGMGVYFRYWVKPSTTWEVAWLDLTNFVSWEDAKTTVEVGAKPRTS